MKVGRSLQVVVSPYGPMDKAPAYGAGDSGFESRNGLFFQLERIIITTDSLVVMTSASHAEGREFNPRSEHTFYNSENKEEEETEICRKINFPPM